MSEQFFDMIASCLYLWEAVSTCKEYQNRGLQISWKAYREDLLVVIYNNEEYEYTF